jgi:uncharacterized membrane protein YraQ (UPF0718 family)
MLKERLVNPLFSIARSLPIMIGIILLLGLVKEFLTFEAVSTLFTQNNIIDTFLGSFFGSIFAGNSMNSYVIARELSNAGISFYAITAFLVSWVTVGMLQAPIEVQEFGLSFTVKRNLYSALLAVAVSWFTVSLWMVLV